jgi:hypothetical protein
MSPTCQLQLLPSQTRSLALSQTYCSQSFAHSDNALAHQPPPVKALAGPLCWKHRQMAILLRVTLTARPRLVACCWPELAANKRGRVTSDDRSGASHDRPAALPDGNARKLLGDFGLMISKATAGGAGYPHLTGLLKCSIVLGISPSRLHWSKYRFSRQTCAT